jgi:outer membrane PBP1 activator LpoA protein
MRELTVILLAVVLSGCATMTQGEVRRVKLKAEIVECAKDFSDFNANILDASRACMTIDAYVRRPASRRRR